MSSQGMLLKSASDGNCMSVSWFVGVFVLCGSSSLGHACCVAPAGAGGALALVLCISCLMSSGVFGSVCIGISGHVVAKQRVCQDSPQLCVSDSPLASGKVLVAYRACGVGVWDAQRLHSGVCACW